MQEKRARTSELLRESINGNMPEQVNLEALKQMLHERGFGLLMMIFALPIAIPFPYPPGFTTVVGIPLLLFSIQMMLGFDSPWLPKRVGNVHIKRDTLVAVTTRTLPYLEKIEYLLKPRLSVASTTMAERIIGFICLLCAVAIALPIPLGNTVPALGILLMSLGLLNRDGIVIMLGAFVSALGIVLAITVVIFGIDGVKHLVGMVF